MANEAVDILRKANADLLAALRVARPWIEQAYNSVASFGAAVSGPASDTLDQIDLAITLAEERLDRAIALAEAGNA